VNLAESITKKIEADASSYSVTALHLCSEKTDGIDHSWARPLAREVIALRLLVQLLATAPETADGTALAFAMRPFPRSKTHFSVR